MTYALSDQSLAEAVTRGPVVILINAADSYFQTYSKGVLGIECRAVTVTKSVLVVGVYDDYYNGRPLRQLVLFF